MKKNDKPESPQNSEINISDEILDFLEGNSAQFLGCFHVTNPKKWPLYENADDTGVSNISLADNEQASHENTSKSYTNNLNIRSSKTEEVVIESGTQQEYVDYKDVAKWMRPSFLVTIVGAVVTGLTVLVSKTLPLLL